MALSHMSVLVRSLGDENLKDVLVYLDTLANPEVVPLDPWHSERILVVRERETYYQFCMVAEP